MYKFTLLFLCSMLLTTHLIAQPTPGFSSVTNLTPMPIPRSTKDIQQAKVWNHAGKWWTVLPTFDGTKLFRLDGTTWTEALMILPSSTNSKTDCRVVGNVAHILLFRGDNHDSYILSLEYDQASGNYKYWSQRPTLSSLRFEADTETASFDIDGSGRMWIASDDLSNINVRWSDFPYSAWSAPIQIASGVKNADISAITALPGKIGVIWSNQNTERFGFRTHANGTDPTLWTADEVPASQSANNLNDGMADDHINLAVSSNGTLYCAVKTGWNTDGMARMALLVRRPDGTWDDLYTVDAFDGNRPIVLLNETLGKLKVVYVSDDSGGNIVYRESSTSGISFGPSINLISNGHLNSYAASTHQTYNQEVVVLATNESTTPLQLVGVIGRDGDAVPDTITPPPTDTTTTPPPTDTTTTPPPTDTTTVPPPTDTSTGPRVASFTLINASTEQGVMTITDGAVINLGTLGFTKMNIRANTTPGSVGSVKLELSGTQTRTYIDGGAPYALHGDDGSGNYYYGNWNPPALGTYTLKATPYSGAKATGEAGTPLTITFTFTNAANNSLLTVAEANGSSKTAVKPASKSGVLQAEALAYPNPFSASATISFTLPQSDQYTVTLHDATGRKVSLLKQGWAAAGVRHSVPVAGARLTGGIYFVQIRTTYGTKTLRLLHSK